MINNIAQMCFIIRWVLHIDKVFIAILLAVINDKDKMLKYILAYDKQHYTNVFIIRCELHNDKKFFAILLSVVSDKDKMLKYIIAYHSL